MVSECGIAESGISESGISGFRDKQVSVVHISSTSVNWYHLLRAMRLHYTMPFWFLTLSCLRQVSRAAGWVIHLKKLPPGLPIFDPITTLSWKQSKSTSIAAARNKPAATKVSPKKVKSSFRSYARQRRPRCQI